MPLFFAPRRPLLRGAMLGGAAYMAGRAGAREAQQTAPPPAPAAPGGSDVVAELTKLKGLLDSGVLDQREFEAAKQRVLAGG